MLDEGKVRKGGKGKKPLTPPPSDPPGGQKPVSDADRQRKARLDTANRLLEGAKEHDGFNLEIRLARKAEGHSGDLRLHISIVLDGELKGCTIPLLGEGPLKERLERGMKFAVGRLLRTLEEHDKKTGDGSADPSV